MVGVPAERGCVRLGAWRESHRPRVLQLGAMLTLWGLRGGRRLPAERDRAADGAGLQAGRRLLLRAQHGRQLVRPAARAAQCSRGGRMPALPWLTRHGSPARVRLLCAEAARQTEACCLMAASPTLTLVHAGAATSAESTPVTTRASPATGPRSTRRPTRPQSRPCPGSASSVRTPCQSGVVGVFGMTPVRHSCQCMPCTAVYSCSRARGCMGWLQR